MTTITAVANEALRGVDKIKKKKAQLGASRMTTGTCLDSDKNHSWIRIRSVFGNQKRMAEFKAMITSFSDSFSSSWNSESVFARMDPIPTFQRTGRKINITFNVPATGPVDGEYTLNQVERLIQFMYPIWNNDEVDMNPMPQAAPLVDIKFSNLISGRGPGGWLSGYIGGLTISHGLDGGVFYADRDGTIVTIPKQINISFDFTVLHEHRLGFWEREGKIYAPPIAPKFPYGVGNVPLGSVTGAPPPEKEDELQAANTAVIDKVAAGLPGDSKIELSTKEGAAAQASVSAAASTVSAAIPTGGIVIAGHPYVVTDPKEASAIQRRMKRGAIAGNNRSMRPSSRPALRTLGEAPGPTPIAGAVPGIGVKPRHRLPER